MQLEKKLTKKVKFTEEKITESFRKSKTLLLDNKSSMKKRKETGQTYSDSESEDEI
jgi:hypothetical protein